MTQRRPTPPHPTRRALSTIARRSAALLALPAAYVAAQWLLRERRPGPVERVAHRGGAATAPENTLAAFQAAAAAGVLLAMTAVGKLRSGSAPLSLGRAGVAMAARHRIELTVIQTRLAAAQESAAAVDVETLPSTEDASDSGPSNRAPGNGRPGDPATAGPARGRPRGPAPARDIDPLSTRK